MVRKKYERVNLDKNQVKNIVDLYNIQNLNIKTISAKYRVEEEKISKLLKKNGVILRSVINEHESKAIISDYINGFSFEDIEVKYKRSFYRIKKIFEENNVEIRPCKFHEVDENYFNEIDSHQKAYFLGLIMADGSVRWNRPKNKLSVLKIGLQKPDGYILQEFIKDIKYTGGVKYVERNEPGKQSSAIVQITNIEFTNKLWKFGVYPNKSMSHPFFKNVPEEYISSAILGYFDGDGSVSYSEKIRKLTTSFIGSQEFIEELRKVLLENGIKCNIRDRITKDNIKMREVRTSGNNQSINLYNYMYKNIIPHLSRKSDKFEIVVNGWKSGAIKNTSYFNNKK